MNQRIQYGLITGILTVLFLVPACGKNKNESKEYPVKIRKENNVIQIVNPNFPKVSLREFTLKEELSIGNDTDDDSLFLKIRKLKVDDKGDIYAADARRNHVCIFDEKGIFKKRLGKKGIGPGEIGRLSDLIIDEKNSLIHILDGKLRKVVRYGFDGTLESDLKLIDGAPDQLFLDPNGLYVVRYSFLDDNGYEKFKILKYTGDGKRLPYTREFEASKSKDIQGEGGLVISASIPFVPKSYFAYDRNGNLYHGFSDKYEISIFDANLNIKKIIRKSNHERLKVSKSELKEFKDSLIEGLKKKGIGAAIDKFEFPDYHQVFTALWLDDKDRLLVETRTTDDTSQIDVFNSEGIYVEKMIIERPIDGISLRWIFYLPVFLDGYVYAVVMDEDDVMLVKKYRLIEKKSTKEK